MNADLNQDVLRRLLGVFHKDIEVTVRIENSGVDQFVFGFLSASSSIGFDQFVIGIGRLRVLVEILHVGVRRRAIEIEVIFLHVLAVIAFAVGEAEQTLFEDRILPIPEREGETEQLGVVRDDGKTVFATVEGARAGMVVTEVILGVAVMVITFVRSTSF